MKPPIDPNSTSIFGRRLKPNSKFNGKPINTGEHPDIMPPSTEGLRDLGTTYFIPAQKSRRIEVGDNQNLHGLFNLRDCVLGPPPRVGRTECPGRSAFTAN